MFMFNFQYLDTQPRVLCEFEFKAVLYKGAYLGTLVYLWATQITVYFSFGVLVIPRLLLPLLIVPLKHFGSLVSSPVDGRRDANEKIQLPKCARVIFGFTHCRIDASPSLSPVHM